MSHSNQNPLTEENKKRKLNSVPDSDDDSTSTIRSFAKFLVVEPVDRDVPIKFSIFAIHKFASCAIGAVVSAKLLRSGDILVEVASRAQYDCAMALTMWVDVPVKVSEHRRLNTSRGIIRCRDLRDCSDDEILEALQPGGVTAIKRISISRNGKSELTNTMILTFKFPTPPKKIKVAYMSIPVELYIPNPLRCYKCQKYGHSQTACSRTPVCARCSKPGHDDKDCRDNEHCINCNGDHPAFSRDCPEWRRQRDITRLKFEKNVSFAEAQQLLKQSQSTPTVGKSYASAARSAQTISTQTDITWPVGAADPVALPCCIATQTVHPAITTAPSTSSATSALPPSSSYVPSTTAPTSSSTTGTKQQSVASSSKPAASSSTVKSHKHVRNNSSGPSIIRPSKGSEDPIKLFNKFGSLDDMEVDSGPIK